MKTAKLESAISISVQKEPKDSSTIQQSEQEEVFRVENDGKVFWKKDGKFRQAKIDSELAQAFACVVIKLAGLDYKKLIDKIKKTKLAKEIK